jgi:hypothetical protein
MTTTGASTRAHCSQLWTRLVTFAMTDVAERNNMLSASQAGFSNKRSTPSRLR